MKTKKLLALVSIFLALSIVSISTAQPTAGVKPGDWIQYQVTFTGAPSPDHDITEARMEIIDVSGPLIYVNITSTFSNGTQVTTKSTLNLQTGQLIDDFIIPANLNTGDKFLDSQAGNITIANTEQRSYAGASRSVVTATSGDNTYIWDQATGVSVEGTSTGADYTMHSLATATNMWQAPGIDPIVIYALVFLIVLIVAASALLFLRRRKGRLPKPESSSDMGQNQIHDNQ